MFKWATLATWKHCLVNCLRVHCLRQNATTTWAAQCFVRSERDNVGIRHGVRVCTTSYETSKVSDVEHEKCADFVSDCFERFRIKSTRIASCSSNNHLWTMFKGKVAHLFKVNSLFTCGDSVGLEVVENAARIDWRSVGEVTAVVKTETQNSVAWIQKTQVNSHVCACTRMRLHVCMLSTKQLLHPRNC